MASILQALKYIFILAILAALAVRLHVYFRGDMGGIKTEDRFQKELRTLEEKVEGDVRDIVTSIEKPLKQLISPPRPDRTDMSTIQRRVGKGYCYVGTDRGYRSCIYVSNNDKCMSEEIYPSRDICINPKLRT